MIKIYKSANGDWIKVYRNGSLWYEGQDWRAEEYIALLERICLEAELYIVTNKELDELGIYLENPS